MTQLMPLEAKFSFGNLFNWFRWKTPTIVKPQQKSIPYPKITSFFSLLTIGVFFVRAKEKAKIKLEEQAIKATIKGLEKAIDAFKNQNEKSNE
jgi:hypothetical protein